MKTPKHTKAPGAFATECERRRPKFKIHRTLGHARSSRSNWGQYYAERAERANGEWVELSTDTIESAKWRLTFDVYHTTPSGQWVHMPEESIDPEAYEYELRPVVVNEYSVEKHGANPLVRPRVFYRKKAS